MKKIVTILFLSIALISSAQTIENNSNWFAYTGQYFIKPKLGYHIEAQFRLDGEFKRSNQNLFRLGLLYQVNDKNQVAFGLGLINTFNAGFNDYFSEKRIWQQYQNNSKWNGNKNSFINRFRLEQRFVDKLGIINNSTEKIETNYQNRLRYLNRNLFHIIQITKDKEELYGIVQNEIFLNLGTNNVNNSFIDQNRFLIGLGLNYKNEVRIEIGYLNHFINTPANENVMNHTISFALFQNLKLYN